MSPDDEKIMRMAKEIVVKYIELGRVSPAGFEESFRNIFWSLKRTIVDAQMQSLDSETLAPLKNAADSESSEDGES